MASCPKKEAGLNETHFLCYTTNMFQDLPKALDIKHYLMQNSHRIASHRIASHRIASRVLRSSGKLVKQAAACDHRIASFTL